jgi:hypothetical protein
MTRSQWLSIFAAACCTILLLSAIASAADSTFSVSSFIPKKFVDFQWSVEGSLDLHGSSYDHQTIELDTNRVRYENESTDELQVLLNSKLVYQYQTIPRFFACSLNVMSDIGFKNNQSGYGSYNKSASNLYEFSSKWMRQHMPNISLSTNMGTYVANDFFMGGSISAQWVYFNRPDGFNSFAASTNQSTVSKSAASYQEAQSLEEKSDYRGYLLEAEVGPGWGRVYEGKYSATALYMIRELSRCGVLKRQPTYEEMTDLAKMIYKYRLTHYIDRRLFKIEALSGLIKKLVQAGLIDETGPMGYLLIQDVWDFFPVYDRRFGLMLRTGIGFDFEYYSSQETITEPGYTYHHYYGHAAGQQESPYAFAKIDYFRPIGMRWQMDLSGNWKYYFNPSQWENSLWKNYGYVVTETATHYSYKFSADYDASLNAAIRYIYDSRTSAVLNSYYDFAHYNSSREQDSSRTRSDYVGKNLGIKATMEYRISMPTTLSINLYYSHSWDENITDHNVSKYWPQSYSILIYLTHHLF